MAKFQKILYMGFRATLNFRKFLAVDLELWLAILSSLLCPETDRQIRIGKQGYVFYFTDFKTSISVSTVVLTLGKVEFLK